MNKLNKVINENEKITTSFLLQRCLHALYIYCHHLLLLRENQYPVDLISCPGVGSLGKYIVLIFTLKDKIHLDLSMHM